MQITEPTTMITDYLLAFFTLVLSGRLFKLNEADRQVSVQLWNFAFIATAAAAIFGGTAHGFDLHLNSVAKLFLWKGTVYAIGFASFFMLSGTIVGTMTNMARRWLLMLASLQLIVYAFWMLTHNDFRYVIFDYVPAMIAVLFLQGFAHVGLQAESARWIIAGILVSFLAAGIQLSGVTIHKHFNHNDLYHVVQMGGMYLLYRGVRVLRDRQPGQTLRRREHEPNVESS